MDVSSIFLIQLSSWLCFLPTLQQPVYFIYYLYSGMGMKNSANLEIIEQNGNGETWIDGILSMLLRDDDEDGEVYRD